MLAIFKLLRRCETYGTCPVTIISTTLPIHILSNRLAMDMSLRSSVHLARAFSDPSLSIIHLTTNRLVIRPLIMLPTPPIMLPIPLITTLVNMLITGPCLTTKSTILEYSNPRTSAHRNIRLLVSTTNLKRNAVLKTFSYPLHHLSFPPSSLGRGIMQH